ncbi:PAS domain-containing sensor histidine kinase [Sunxiuqinia sp. A32]|uniref:PAS domain-containing sensor histidine kinase n=1 Tax=Sunxiuqinia sp. A32 TaxID=3461496 RepID=UPI0040462881
MLKSIYHFITKPFLFETDEEIRKIIGLHIVMLAALVFSIIDLSVAILGRPVYACIPGDITIITIGIIGLYCLRTGKTICTVNSIFLAPFVIYFFHISKQYSVLPIHQSIPNTLWVLIASLIFLVLFDGKLKKISIFFGWALITLLFHIYQADRISDILLYKWPGNDMAFNPVLQLILAYGITFFVTWNFSISINDLRTKLNENEKQVNQTVKGFQQGVLLMEIVRDEMENPVGLKILKTNPAFESMFRVQARELREADAEVIFPKVFRDSFQWNSFYLQSTKKKTEIHVDHLNKWFEVFNLSPAPDQIASIFYDVSQKQKNIESLQDSRRRYKVLLEAIPDIFFIIDKDGIYMDFVIKESELIQITADDIVGNSIFEVGFSEKMSRKIFQCIQDAIQFETIETIEYALEVEKGTAMFEMRIAKLDDNSVISIARDITKRKVAEIKLEEAKIKAEEADQLKSAFLANISHEIRTPMNAIIGFSKMIGSPDFDMEEKNRFIEIIVSNGKLLMEMINDMISLSKIESNQIIVKKDFCKINDMMLDLYREYSYDVSNKPIKLKLSNENANPKFGVTTDKAILMEVMQKLLDNAVKFTDDGEIEFGYKLLSKDQLQFFVRDTGIGIDEAQITKIFERFHQVDNKTTRRYEGTGLGLAIAQHFVKLIEGTIAVKSELGSGSTFYFNVPFKGGEGTLTIVR